MKNLNLLEKYRGMFREDPIHGDREFSVHDRHPFDFATHYLHSIPLRVSCRHKDYHDFRDSDPSDMIMDELDEFGSRTSRCSRIFFSEFFWADYFYTRVGAERCFKYAGMDDIMPEFSNRTKFLTSSLMLLERAKQSIHRVKIVSPGSSNYVYPDWDYNESLTELERFERMVHFSIDLEGDQGQLFSLHENLRDAVLTKDYEVAAMWRDKIREIS